MGVWGSGTPRWLLLLGIAVGLWYQVILAMVLARSGLRHGGAAIVIGAFGVLTVGGCIHRLRKRIPGQRPA